MKKEIKYLLAILLVSMSNLTFSQSGEFWVRYHINQADTNSYDVYFKTKDSTVTYEEGWTTTRTVGDKEFEYTIDKKTTKKVQVDEAVNLGSKWESGEIKYSDKDPSKIFLNPLHFEDRKKYNMKGHIKVPENQRVRLTKTFFKLSPLVIPFAVRFRLNDTIKSQATSDLNIGVGISYNINSSYFKNRRIKASTSSYGVSFGVGLGFTKISLSSSNTSLSEEPLKADESGLALTFAPGIGFNLQQVSLAFFYAYDIPLTSNVRKWDYFNHGYLGIGLGINLSTFGALGN